MDRNPALARILLSPRLNALLSSLAKESGLHRSKEEKTEAMSTLINEFCDELESNELFAVISDEIEDLRHKMLGSF